MLFLRFDRAMAANSGAPQMVWGAPDTVRPWWRLCSVAYSVPYKYMSAITAMYEYEYITIH